MDAVVGLLALAVGVLVGVFLTLLMDELMTRPRLETFIAANQVLQKETRTLERKLAVARTQAEMLNTHLAETASRADRLTKDVRSLRRRLDEKGEALAAATITVEKQKAHFDTLNAHLEGLQQENAEGQERWATAVADSKRLQSELAQLRQAVTDAEREQQTMAEQLAEAQEALTAVQTRAAQIPQLEADKETLQQAVQTAETRARTLTAQVNGLTRKLAITRRVREQLTETEAELLAAHKKATRLQKRYGRQNHLIENVLRKDDWLEVIQGIGPVYARRLREHGVESLYDLAQAEPARLAEIVGLKSWQGNDPAAWIAEARELIGEDES